MRKSFLTSSLPGASNGNASNNLTGRCTEFIAMVDHAELADTSKFSFTEHANRDDLRIFELTNSVKSNIRHIGVEEPDTDYDYCIAFLNRRTKEVEYKPISFLHVTPRNKNDVEKSGLLEGKKRRLTTNYAIDNSFSNEDFKDKRNNLTVEFGNTRKRKMLEASIRRRIGDESMSIMNDSLMNQSIKTDTAMSPSADAPGNIPSIDQKISMADISLLKTPTSMILPKINFQAKNPKDVFDLKDFFEKEELKDFTDLSKTFFDTYSTLDTICKLGVAKFMARRALENYGQSDLCKAAALKLIILALILPKGRLFTTDVDFVKINYLTPRVKLHIETQFLHGKINRQGKYVVERMYKEKIMSHLFSLYFALSVTGNYTLPLGWIVTELQISDTIAKSILQNIGCLIQTATPEEMRTLNTTQVARLVGPGKTSARNRGRVHRF